MLSPFVVSILILPIYVFLFKQGWFDMLLSVKETLFLNMLVVLLGVFLIFGIHYLESPSEFYIGLNREADGYFVRALFFACLPLLLTLSTLVFVFQGGYVGNRWMFMLAFITSIMIFSIPFIWIPMIVYYPIMKKITLSYRLNLIKTGFIKNNSRQCLKEYKNYIGYFYLFVGFNVLLVFLLDFISEK